MLGRWRGGEGGEVKPERRRRCSANGLPDHWYWVWPSYTGLPSLMGQVTRERDSSPPPPPRPLLALSSSSALSVADHGRPFGEGDPDRAPAVARRSPLVGEALDVVAVGRRRSGRAF